MVIIVYVLMLSFLVFFYAYDLSQMWRVMFYSFSKNILNSYWVAGTGFDTEDTVVPETDLPLLA